jgi:hypothetical protein
MYLDQLTTQVNRFLSDQSPEVLSIKGRWGIGKTYTWDKLLKEAKCRNNIALENYSYISLFGINSLTDLKLIILNNTINIKDIGKKININSISKENTLPLGRSWRKITGYINGIKVPWFDVKSIVGIASSYLISKTIICIDDLERIGKGLDMRDVFGLISLLKEQKDCKIVIIHNDNVINDKDYKKHLEKIIDVELLFDPPPEECANIAISVQNEKELNILKKYAIKLKIKNIRTLKKIERLVRICMPILKNCDAQIKERVISVLVLYSWCYYCSDDGAPNFNYMKRSSDDIIKSSLSNTKREKNIDEIKWDTILNDYGYSYMDDLDSLLMDGVVNGYFDEAQLSLKIKEENDKEIYGKRQNSIHSIHDLFFNSFDNNEEEIVKSYFLEVSNNAKYIRPPDLSFAVKLLRELGLHEKASDLIDIYINERKEDISFFSKEVYMYISSDLDSEIITKFDEYYSNNNTKQENTLSVIKRIVDNNSWSKNDIAILSSESLDNYCKIFKTIKGKELSNSIYKCFHISESANNDPYLIQMKHNIREALKIIGNECAINSIRVRKYIGSTDGESDEKF